MTEQEISTLHMQTNMQDVTNQNRMDLFIAIYKETCNTYPPAHCRDFADKALEHFDQKFLQEQDEGLSFPDPGEVLPPNEEDCIYTAPGPGGARPVRKVIKQGEGTIEELVNTVSRILQNPLTESEKEGLCDWIRACKSQGGSLDLDSF